MKKSAVDRQLLHLLVAVYNQRIQTYYHFPEVILCGRRRLEYEDFARLLTNDFLVICSSDSFGRYYQLSKRGENFLFQELFPRRQRHAGQPLPAQCRFSFVGEYLA